MSAASPAAAGSATAMVRRAGSGGVDVRLYVGYACAGVALVTAMDAARARAQEDDWGLGAHAVVLLCCVLPLRVIVMGARGTGVGTGVLEAVVGALLFASNAMHVVVAKRLPDNRMGELVAYAVLDVTANWLRMVVGDREGIEASGAWLRDVVSAAVCGGGDMWLAGVVAGVEEVVQALYPLIVGRAVLNILVLGICAAKIVRRDEDKKRIDTR